MLDIELLVACLFSQLLGFGQGLLRFDGQSVKPDHALSPFQASTVHVGC